MDVYVAVQVSMFHYEPAPAPDPGPPSLPGRDYYDAGLSHTLPSTVPHPRVEMLKNNKLAAERARQERSRGHRCSQDRSYDEFYRPAMAGGFTTERQSITRCLDRSCTTTGRIGTRGSHSTSPDGTYPPTQTPHRPSKIALFSRCLFSVDIYELDLAL